MTEKQCLKAIGRMMVEIRGLVKSEARRLYRSGGVDPVTIGDGLPKVLLTVALENIADKCHPFCATSREAVKNLRNF